MKLILPIIIVFIFISKVNATNNNRDRIGEVLGQPVYRDQISAKEGFKLYSELQTLFARPVLKKYYEKHRTELEPTEQEISQFVAYYAKKHEAEMKNKKSALKEKLAVLNTKLENKKLSSEERQDLEIERDIINMDLKPPGRDFAMFVIPQWKLQFHFYKQYGGGRLLWQQRGVEAFDAMYNWLTQQEKSGLFKITDPKMREAFYSYWTSMDHGSFFINDKARIENEFLTPEWKSK